MIMASLVLYHGFDRVGSPLFVAALGYLKDSTLVGFEGWDPLPSNQGKANRKTLLTLCGHVHVLEILGSWQHMHVSLIRSTILCYYDNCATETNF